MFFYGVCFGGVGGAVFLAFSVVGGRGRGGGGGGQFSRQVCSHFTSSSGEVSCCGLVVTALGFFRQYIGFCGRLGCVSSKQGGSHVYNFGFF